MKEVSFECRRPSFIDDLMDPSCKRHEYLVHDAVGNGMGENKKRYGRKERSVYFFTLFLFGIWWRNHRGDGRHIILRRRNVCWGLLQRNCIHLFLSKIDDCGICEIDPVKIACRGNGIRPHIAPAQPISILKTR